MEDQRLDKITTLTLSTFSFAFGNLNVHSMITYTVLGRVIVAMASAQFYASFIIHHSRPTDLIDNAGKALL